MRALGSNKTHVFLVIRCIVLIHDGRFSIDIELPQRGHEMIFFINMIEEGSWALKALIFCMQIIETNVFLLFEVIIIGIVSSFRFIWSDVYGRQIMTSDRGNTYVINHVG